MLISYLRLPYILIPFTINNMFVKSALRCNVISLRCVSVCAQSLEILAERYDAADFYMALLDESLAITHRMMLETGVGNQHSQPGRRREATLNSEPTPAEVPLPQVDIYSSVIRFQDASFATGCVEKEGII